MGQICTTITDLDDFSLASKDLAATACASVLNRVRAIMAAPASAAGFGDIAPLIGLTHRIEACLATGRAAVERNDLGSAVLEHARALVLMNSMPLVAARSGRRPRQSANQKSGITG